MIRVIRVIGADRVDFSGDTSILGVARENFGGGFWY